eukprot:480014_1
MNNNEFDVTKFMDVSMLESSDDENNDNHLNVNKNNDPKNDPQNETQNEDVVVPQVRKNSQFDLSQFCNLSMLESSGDEQVILNPNQNQNDIDNNNTFPNPNPNQNQNNDGWKCPVCTSINNINLPYCEVCYCQKNDTQLNEIGNTENEISDAQILETKYQTDADEIKQDHEFSLKIENKKRIIFIRHSQSTWNEAEKSSFFKTTQSLTGGILELMSYDTVQKSLTGGILESMYNTVENGGKYIDAPLSDYGIIQSTDLNTFIQHNYTQYQLKNILTGFHNKNSDKHIQKLQQLSSFNSNNAGNQFAFNISIDENNTNDKLIEKDILNLIGIHNHNNSSCVLTSNLRRSIDTAILGLSTRWQMFPNQKMYILSCLQEFGKGPDSFCKTKANEVPKISEYTQQNKRINLKSFQNFYSTRIDVSGNNGPKRLPNSLKDISPKNNDAWRFGKMLEFCRYVFKRKESTIIVVGHSLWFKTFFKVFLSQQNKNDKETSHISSESKMYNGGCVGFDLCQIIKGRNDDYSYSIDARTMVNVYKGFEKM